MYGSIWTEKESMVMVYLLADSQTKLWEDYTTHVRLDFFDPRSFVSLHQSETNSEGLSYESLPLVCHTPTEGLAHLVWRPPKGSGHQLQAPTLSLWGWKGSLLWFRFNSMCVVCLSWSWQESCRRRCLLIERPLISDCGRNSFGVWVCTVRLWCPCSRQGGVTGSLGG